MLFIALFLFSLIDFVIVIISLFDFRCFFAFLGTMKRWDATLGVSAAFLGTSERGVKQEEKLLKLHLFAILAYLATRKQEQHTQKECGKSFLKPVFVGKRITIKTQKVKLRTKETHDNSFTFSSVDIVVD